MSGKISLLYMQQKLIIIGRMIWMIRSVDFAKAKLLQKSCLISILAQEQTGFMPTLRCVYNLICSRITRCMCADWSQCCMQEGWLKIKRRSLNENCQKKKKAPQTVEDLSTLLSRKEGLHSEFDKATSREYIQDAEQKKESQAKCWKLAKIDFQDFYWWLQVW